MRTTHLFIVMVAMMGFVACSDDTTIKPGLEATVKPKEASTPTEAGVKKEASTPGKEASAPVAKFCQCAADADCSSVTGTTLKICNTTSHGCVACGKDADCTKGTSNTGVCTTATGSCNKCAADADCTASYLGKFCNTTTNLCIGCKVDADCATPTYKGCDTASGACLMCKVDADCTKGTSNTGACMTSGALKGYCMKCAGDADCTAAGIGKFCNTTTNTCYACKADADCSGGKLIFCNITTGQCTCGATADCTASYPGGGLTCK